MQQDPLMNILNKAKTIGLDIKYEDKYWYFYKYIINII